VNNWKRAALGTCGIAACAVAAAAAAASFAVGDVYTYRLVNAYNKELLAQVRYEVSGVEPDRIRFSVTPDQAAGGAQRTEVYTREGNWLRAPVESHGEPVEYEFAPAYPALVFPLEPGKEWSVRVAARVAGEARARSVRVDGKVLGAERVRVPAGEYDAIKIRRFVYPGDAAHFLTETRIVEYDWYVPALGRVVRSERNSDWRDGSRCDSNHGCDYYGNWSVLELAEARPAKS
jgi:hypothetical protein